jgi:prepilin-type N-terminal cleavage/methylation domain-containing protein
MFRFDRKKDGGTGSWLPGIFRGSCLNHNAKGFTLLEMMAVLVIMGSMFSITIKKFDLISDTASLTALKVGVRELNTRETLEWTKIKLSDEGWKNDRDVYAAVDKQIGQGYSWNPLPDVTGGKLHFKAQSIDLNRNTSTNNSTGAWH